MSKLTFCLILDIAILATMVLVAVFTKTAWGLVLVFAMQKTETRNPETTESKS